MAHLAADGFARPVRPDLIIDALALLALVVIVSLVVLLFVLIWLAFRGE